MHWSIVSQVDKEDMFPFTPGVLVGLFCPLLTTDRLAPFHSVYLYSDFLRGFLAKLFSFLLIKNTKIR